LIVYAWNQNTGYRFFWALSLYSVLYKSTLNNIHKCNGIDFHQRFPRPASSKISVQRHVFFFVRILHFLFLLPVCYFGKRCQWDQMSLSLVRDPSFNKRLSRGSRWGYH
jgi:hypothetical protein